MLYPERLLVGTVGLALWLAQRTEHLSLRAALHLRCWLWWFTAHRFSGSKDLVCAVLRTTGGIVWLKVVLRSDRVRGERTDGRYRTHTTRSHVMMLASAVRGAGHHVHLHW